MLVEDRRTEKDWRLGFRSLETEIGDGVELEVEGTLPAELEGTLYRIGPARHDVYGERYRHWFDGDGMVHTIHLDGGRAHYRNRFVATAGRAEEERAGRRLYAGFGTRPAGDNAVERFRHAVRRFAKNTANTNIVEIGGRLLALWEAGHPHRIDPVTLAILQSALAGALAPVFWGIALLSVGALLVGLWFPRLHVDQLAGDPTQVPRGVGKATRQTTR